MHKVHMVCLHRWIAVEHSRDGSEHATQHSILSALQQIHQAGLKTLYQLTDSNKIRSCMSSRSLLVTSARWARTLDTKGSQHGTRASNSASERVTGNLIEIVTSHTLEASIPLDPTQLRILFRYICFSSSRDGSNAVHTFSSSTCCVRSMCSKTSADLIDHWFRTTSWYVNDLWTK